MALRLSVLLSLHVTVMQLQLQACDVSSYLGMQRLTRPSSAAT